jgi:ABC-2 type transport system permease protein
MTTSDDALPPLVENGARSRGVIARTRDVWEYRELLGNLVRRELKVRYKDSVLGFLWTLLNPLLYLAVFSVVFGGFLRSGVPMYGLFLLSGLLAWNLFSTGVTGATGSVIMNAPLVQKVWFPREILPIAAVGASIVNFAFQLIVLGVGLVVFWHPPEWSMLPLLVPALIVTVVFAMGLGLMFSALNVYLRDVQHFLELAFLAWFWLTPVVYQYNFIATSVRDRFGAEWERLVLLNPMVAVVTTFQRVIYNPDAATDPANDPFTLLFRPVSWYLTNLAIVGVLGVVLLVLGIKIFGRLEANLGEEI